MRGSDEMPSANLFSRNKHAPLGGMGYVRQCCSNRWHLVLHDTALRRLEQRRRHHCTSRWKDT